MVEFSREMPNGRSAEPDDSGTMAMLIYYIGDSGHAEAAITLAADRGAERPAAAPAGPLERCTSRGVTDGDESAFQGPMYSHASSLSVVADIRLATQEGLMTALLLNSCNVTVNPVADNDHREHEVNVLIADDHRSRSYHIWASLSSLRAVPRISTGESREEVLRLAARHAPEVSLVSATFGGGEGFTIADRLKHCTAPAPVLIYADAVDPRLAGAAIVAGADGTFAWEADANRLGELIGRVLHGEKLFPPLLPDPFEELASHVAEEDRRIVAMLLSGGDPDAIARSCGISARGFTSRRQAIVRRLDAAYARGPVSPPRAQPSHQVCDDALQHASPPVIFG